MIVDFNRIDEFDKGFTGRQRELEWLDEHLYRRDYSFTPTIIAGVAGVGKTALVKQWLLSRRRRHIPLWVELRSENKDDTLDEVIKHLEKERERYLYPERLIVVIDGSDHWSATDHQEASAKIFNYKAVESLIFTTRAAIHIEKSFLLELKPFTEGTTYNLVEKEFADTLNANQIQEIVELSKGYPLAISLLGKLIKEGG